MQRIECNLLSCVHNDRSLGKYGVCQHSGPIHLKWRFAVDLGKGNVVCVECLELQLPEEP